MLVTWLIASLAAWLVIIWQIISTPRYYGRKPEMSRARAAMSLLVYAVGFSLPVPVVLLITL